MTPTKLLIGQILVVFAIVIAGIWFATQWAAAKLAYQPQLGPAWFVLFHMPVYRPWAIFPWWYRYDAYAPHVFDRAGAIAGASGFVGCGAAIIGSLWRARQTRHVTTYGSARWASTREVERAVQAGVQKKIGPFTVHAQRPPRPRREPVPATPLRSRRPRPRPQRSSLPPRARTDD